MCIKVRQGVYILDVGSFIKGRSCSNNIWLIHRVSERTIEFPMHCALVDYKDAFDSLNRTTLGRVLCLFLSPNMVRRVLSLYFDEGALVSVDGTNGPEFSVELDKVTLLHQAFL